MTVTRGGLFSGNTLLVADDDATIRFALRDFFSTHGCRVVEADSCASAERAFIEEIPDAAVLDYQLPDGDVLELLPRLRDITSQTPIVILTAFATIERAVRAIQLGADQFLTKPVDLPALHAVLERQCERGRVLRRESAVEARMGRGDFYPFLGGSPAIQALREESQRAVASDSPVLILGETGSGKGVLARWIHRNGPRAREPFVDINCAGLSRDLLESELFGYEKGAFTGAAAAKQGLLEAAHRGTVFLDEIGDMDLSVQAKVLKVLDDRRFRRLGDIRDRRVDVRVIAATHRDLPARTRDERFREDLYYRLNVLVLEVPPLRERRADIPELADRVLEAVVSDMRRDPVRLSPEARSALAAHSWPGNIRELRNVLERSALRVRGSEIRPSDLRIDAERLEPVAVSSSPLAQPAGPSSGAAVETLEQVERLHIVRMLDLEGGRVGNTARRLGIARSTLYKRLKELGIPTP